MKKLWKYNKLTGYWVFIRECNIDTAKNWLEIFSNDEPKEKFMLSRKNPNKK